MLVVKPKFQELSTFEYPYVTTKKKTFPYKIFWEKKIFINVKIDIPSVLK